MVPKPTHEELAQMVKEGLEFPRGVLVLLQETRLFSPLIDDAIRQIDEILEAADEKE